MNKIRIEVTQKHIDEGEKRDCFSCPIALALYESMPQKTPKVEGCWTRIGKRTVHNSPRTRAFISDFDEGYPVKPCILILTEDTLTWQEGEE